MRNAAYRSLLTAHRFWLSVFRFLLRSPSPQCDAQRLEFLAAVSGLLFHSPRSRPRAQTLSAVRVDGVGRVSNLVYRLPSASWNDALCRAGNGAPNLFRGTDDAHDH